MVRFLCMPIDWWYKAAISNSQGKRYFFIFQITNEYEIVVLHADLVPFLSFKRWKKEL